MTFHTLDLATLHVLSDAIGRFDYDDAEQEQTREAARDAIAAAIASHTPALPLDIDATRHVTLEELGPETRAVVERAIALGADRLTFNTQGPVFWRDGEQIEAGEVAQTRPAPSLVTLTDGDIALAVAAAYPEQG